MSNWSYDNDGYFWLSMARPNADTGISEPATGLTITAFLSASKDGTAIAGTTITLTELAGTPGDYAGGIGAAAVNSALDAGASFEVYTIPGDYREARRMAIQRIRTA